MRRRFASLLALGALLAAWSPTPWSSRHAAAAVPPTAIEAPAAEPSSAPTLRIETGGHTAMINRLAAIPGGGVVTVSDDKTARIWSSTDGAPLATLRVPIGPGTEGALYAAAVSPTSKSVAVAGYTGLEWDKAGAIYVFDAAGKLAGRLGGLPNSVHALAYSPDGHFLAIGLGEKSGLRIFDITKRSVAKDDATFGDTVTSVAFDRAGRLAAASLDGTIRLYDSTFAPLGSFRMEQPARPWSVAFNPDGSKLAVGALGASSIQLLSTAPVLSAAGTLRGAPERSGAFSVTAWAADGSKLYGAGSYGDGAGNKFVRVWSMAGANAEGRDIQASSDTINDLTPLPEGGAAFATAEPGWGTVTNDGRLGVAQRKSFADFRDAYLGRFRLSEDGSVIEFGFGQSGTKPASFDLNERKLTLGPSALPLLAPAPDKGAITDWRNRPAPQIGGRAVKLDANEISRSAAASADGQVQVLGTDYALRLYRKGEPGWRAAIPAPAWAVNLSKDGKVAVAALGDGTLRWYRVSDGKEVVALFALPDERWILWTPEGFFDHGREGEKLVGYHVNQGKAKNPEFVGIDKFYRNFFRPDVIARKLRGGNEPAVSAELARLGNADAALSKGLPPGLTLVEYCLRDPAQNQTECRTPEKSATRAVRQSIHTEYPEMVLRFGVQDRGGGIGQVLVRRNQANLATRGTTLKTDATGKTEERVIALEPGTNAISISATTGAGDIESTEPLKLDAVFESRKSEASTLYVIAIGIDKYLSKDVPELTNAAADAKGIADSFVKSPKGEMYQDVKATVLTNQQATRAGMLKAFDDVTSKAGVKDMIVVFLAGHGMAIEGKYYFLSYDIPSVRNPEAIKEGGVAQSLLTDMLAKLPTSRVAVLLDTCFAGALAVQDSVVRNSQDRTWVGSLGQSSGRFTLAGTTNQQEALDGEQGHGVFTAMLLEALRGDADAKMGNRDGKVNVYELSTYVEARVPEAAKAVDPTHNQKPTKYFAGSDFFDLRRAD